MSDAYRRRRLWSLALAAVVVLTIVPAAHARLRVAARTADGVPRAAAAAVPAAICEPGGADPDRAVPWFRLDPVLDDGGVLTGQRLVAGSTDDAAPLELSLEPESFASGPTDGLVVAGSDDGRRSTIRLLDAAGDCVVQTLTTTDLVRRAVLDATGGSLYEHRLDRRSRASLGIWRRSIDGSGRAERILEPLPPNERIGLVFATELFWSDDGATLAVLSCGEVACLTRLVGADGAVRLVDDEAIGETLGMAGGKLVGYGRCHGLPCPIVVHDPDAGSTRTIVPASGLARLVTDPDGPSVAFEDVGLGSVAIVDLDGERRRDLAPTPGGLRVVPPAFLASAGSELPPGWFALGPDGRPAERGSDWRAVDADDGRLLPAAEVVP